MHQTGTVFWLTGLSGAGKSTLSEAVLPLLRAENIQLIYLDGDQLRRQLSADLGFGDAARKENVRRAASVAGLIAAQGFHVWVSLMSPTTEMRAMAAKLIGEENFREIYIKTDLQTCISRDPKGLYARALAGEIKDISGLDAAFEPPISPDLVVDTDKLCVEEGVQTLLAFVRQTQMR